MIEYRDNIRPALAFVRSLPRVRGRSPLQAPPEPFVTITREHGTDAWRLARELVDALNATLPASDEHLWTGWDRELVEKVAADHNLSKELIDSLEESDRSWLTDMLQAMSSDDQAYVDEARIYHGVAQTIRALAQAGRVVIVGRGSVFITRQMPGGIHVQLVAPWETRVQNIMKMRNMSRADADAHIRQLDRARQNFLNRHWPSQKLTSDLFDLTINVGKVPMAAAVEMIRAIVAERSPAAVGV
jgi:cytidylate kinase